MALPKRDRQPSPEFTCNVCKREFKTVQGLMGHERMVHGVQHEPKPDQEELMARLETAIRETGEQIGQIIAQVMDRALRECGTLGQQYSELTELKIQRFTDQLRWELKDGLRDLREELTTPPRTGG